MKPHFAKEALRASGLFSSQEKSDDGLPTGELYARFRKRITFPIANEAGKVIAFTARALDPDDKNAKYLNSPETRAIHQGQCAVQPGQSEGGDAQERLCRAGGGADGLHLRVLAGIRNVLAISGTAFTEKQVGILGGSPSA